jgi:hypothetical protein
MRENEAEVGWGYITDQQTADRTVLKTLLKLCLVYIFLPTFFL